MGPTAFTFVLIVSLFLIFYLALYVTLHGARWLVSLIIGKPDQQGHYHWDGDVR